MNVLDYLRLGLRHRQDPLVVHYLLGRDVLDVGCGRGEFLVRDPTRFVGVDVDPQLVAQCAERGLKARVMSAFDLQYPAGSFDAVRAAQLIEHFSPREAAAFLSQCATVLKPGGIVFLTTPGVRNVWNTFSHIRPYPPAALKKFLKTVTEGYIKDTALDLVFETAYGHRRYSEARSIAFLSSALDLMIPPSDPIGWTIILRKRQAQ